MERVHPAIAAIYILALKRGVRLNKVVENWARFVASNRDSGMSLTKPDCVMLIEKYETKAKDQI